MWFPILYYKIFIYSTFTNLLSKLFIIRITIYKRLTNLSQHKRQNKMINAKWIFPNTHPFAQNYMIFFICLKLNEKGCYTLLLARLFMLGITKNSCNNLQTAHNFEMCYSNSVSRRSLAQEIL